MGTIIQAEGLGKKYILNHLQKERYYALRDVMADAVKRWGNKMLRPLSQRRKLDPEHEEFWALNDVLFEINGGDRVGIIGRNGAGKSTLLKILSRITEPTKGRVTITGRVASLLEVGTGFHPELTGRENIYLNGAILGMTRREIKQKFDEIVDFAEIEKFLDTPVKRYSSGMYVRLAFSVAAHLEPDILLVDEVLAVGDAQFQKKSIGKMGDVSTKEGRTVLFVSHNMNAIEQLCTKALFLKGGKIEMFSENTRSVIQAYLFEQEDVGASEWINVDGYYKNPWFQPLKFYLTNEKGVKLTMPVSNNDEIVVNIEAEIKDIDPAMTFGYAIYAEDGTLLYWSYTTDETEEKWPLIKKGVCTYQSKIPKRFLNEGKYKLELLASLHFREWICEPLKAPSLYITIQGGLSDSPYWIAKRPGVIAPVIEWKRGSKT